MFRVGELMFAQIVGAVILVICANSHVWGQTIEAKLEEAGEFHSQKTTLRGQLVDFARRYRIPMGLELVQGNGSPLKPLHVKSDTALNVLRKILQQRPNYDFALSDGVVNVYSIRLVNDHKNFLNLRLPEYRIQDQNLFGATYYLRLTINQTLNPNKNFGGGYGGVGLNNNLHVAKITFSGENLTVRQILNRLISIHDGALWVVNLKPSKTMSGHLFYAQAFPETGASSPEFFWEFIPLR